MKRTGRIVGALLLLLFLVGVGLLGTGAGLDLVRQGVNRLGDGLISIERAEGRLLGRFTLTGIGVTVPTLFIKVARLEWNWNPAKLMGGEFHIAAIDLSEVDVELRDGPKAPDDGEPVILPKSLLPLSLALDRLSIASLRLRDSDGEELLRLDRIDGGLAGRGGLVSIGDFSLQGPDVGLTVHGSLNAGRNWRLDLLGSWRLAGYGFHPLAGTFTATGPLAAPHLSLGLNQPADIRIDGDVVNLFDRPAWTATVAARGVDLSALVEDCPKIDLATVSGKLSGNTDGYRGLVQAEGTWSTLDQMRLQSTIVGGLWGIDFEALRIDRGNGYAVAENAMISWKNIFDWHGLFHFKNFDPSAFTEKLSGMVSADFTSVGKVRDDFGVDVSFEIFNLDGRMWEQPISASGTLAVTENDLRTNGLVVRSGEVEGVARIAKGMISWADRLSWSGEIRLDNFDPSGLNPEFPGRVNGNLAGEGHLGPGGVQGFLKISDISGTLRGNDLAGSGEISVFDETIRTTGLSLRSGGSELVVEGQAGEGFALDFTFSSPDVATLWPEVSGAVRLHGRLAGSQALPLLDADLNGTGIGFGSNAFARLEAKIHAELRRDGIVNGFLRGEKMTVAGVFLDQGQIDFSGSGEEQEAIVKAAGPPGNLRLRVRAVRGEEWTGELADLTLSSSSYGSWQQQDKAAFSADRDGLVLEDFCLADGAASICLGGYARLAEELGWKVKGDFTAVPLDWLNRLKLLDIPIGGVMAGEFAVSGDGHRLETASAEVRAPEIDFALGGADEELNAIHCLGTLLTFHLADSQARTNITTRINNGSRLDLTAAVQDAGEFSAPLRLLPLSGSLKLEDFDLAPLSSLAGYGIDPTGRVNSTLTLGGTVGRPELFGESRIDGGGIALPYQGITLEHVTLSIVAGEEGAKVVGRATSGPGEMTAEGRLRYGGEGVEGDLRLRGRDFLLVNLPEYAFRVSPDVQLQFAENRGVIKGLVEVPYGLITPEEMSDAIKASPDVIVVNGRQEVKEDSWPFSLDLDVRLGEEVRIDGHGLTGRLAGQLRVKTTPDEFLTGTGELDLIDGVYTIYGRTLEIERGRVLFTGGPIDNPGVDVRAQKKFSDEEAKVRGYTVGVDISGLAQDLRYQLFSDPYMEDTEILSQMIVGHSLAFSSQEEDGLLKAAAATLGLKGSTVIFDGIGSILQLDDMHLEGSSKKENVSVVVGKRVTKDLYIGYDMNMFSQLGQFRVRYDLDRGFAVETRSSSLSTGADLLYSFEK